MTQLLFTFTTILFFCITANAQTSSRLIQTTKGQYSATTGKFDYMWDTTRYTYSFGRGGTLNSPMIKFDSCIKKRQSGANVITATYDNQNRAKTYTTAVLTDTNYYTGTQNEPDSIISWSINGTVTYNYLIYNSSRQITKSVQRKIISSTNINTDSTTYTYSAGNLIAENHYYLVNGSMTNSYNITTTYNALNLPLIVTKTQNGDTYRTSYTYNLSGLIDMEIMESTIAGNFKWESKHRYIYTSSNDVSIDSTFTWNSTTLGWQAQYINLYQYDANRNLSIDSMIEFNGTSFNNRKKVSQSFDINNNKLTRLVEGWNAMSLKWGGINVSDTLNTYTYQTYDPTNIQKQKLSPSFKLYPNPSSHFIMADLANIVGIKDYAIYDMTGKLYRRAKVNAGTNTLSIPVADLPNGNYILSFYTDNSTLQQTFVKQ